MIRHNILLLVQSLLYILNFCSQLTEQVVVTAESSIDPNNKVARPLRIEITDLDDNLPDFGQDQGSLPTVFTIDADGGKEWSNGSTPEMAMVGKVHANDVDLPPFDTVNYYLLPSCDNEGGIFDINQTTGEIFISGPMPEGKDMYQLCVLASSLTNRSMVNDIRFAANNRSMINVIVQVQKLMTKIHKAEEHKPTIQCINNSIITYGSGFLDAVIPINTPLRAGKELMYELMSVDFTPAEEETNVTKSMDVFVIDPHTGDVRVDAKLDELSEGVYTLNSVAKEIISGHDYAHLVTQVHHVHDTSRLKYVFEVPVDSLGSSLSSFVDAAQMTINQTHEQLRLIFGLPQIYNWKNPERSAVCFHATENDVLLSKEHVIMILSSLAGNDTELTQIYLQYKVINIELCETQYEVVDRNGPLHTQILWWIFAVLLSVLILFTLTCYLCFLGRYKQYMMGKPKLEQPPAVPPFQRPHMLAITNGPPEAPRFYAKNNAVAYFS